MDQAQGLNVYDLMYYLTPFPIHFLGLQTRLLACPQKRYLLSFWKEKMLIVLD